MTLGNDNGTDGQTDRRTDRVRRNMRPPPREEGRITIQEYKHYSRANTHTYIIMKTKKYTNTDNEKCTISQKHIKT